MEKKSIKVDIPIGREESKVSNKISIKSILNKILFFLIGSSVTCIGSTGLVTSKAFDTDVFISDCFSVFFYLNIVAFLFVLLFIKCNYKKAVISGWITLFFHIMYIIISAFGKGRLAKYFYISVYSGIAILEAFIIQSNSYIVSKYYSSSVFSNLYSGYYGGMATFALIQTIFQKIVGTDTSESARLCLVLTHIVFATIVFISVVSQTIIYVKGGNLENNDESSESLRNSCINKLKGMYRVFLSLPKYSSRFIIFILSDLCKCAFFQLFIPYRMLINDTELVIIFFVDNLCDIIGRSISSSADDTVVAPPMVKGYQRFLFKRDLPFLSITLLSWVSCFILVWSTWKLNSSFIISFPTIVVLTIFVCFSIGYCSTRGMNGCIPILEYFDKQVDIEGNKRFPVSEKENYSYVNDLNTFLLKFLWMLVFLGAYFISKIMERHQSSEYYIELKKLLYLK